jgi:cell wall-associated NlpC family hydrolase
VTKKQAFQLRKYAVAKQRLNATTATVNDKLSLVKKAQAKYASQKAAAEAKLAAAQALLASLTKAERERLAKLMNDQENADQASSLAEVAKLNLGSGRGAIALRFAIKQIGDRYVFGAAGPTLWDCSGLTMRAFQQSGVSLPHSAAAQSGFGKSIPRNKLQPGDLVFFGRGHYISHVGIFIGAGRMVNAPRPGARVKVEGFSSTFGSLAFYGARRI